MKYLDYGKLPSFRARHFPQLTGGDSSGGGPGQQDYIEVVRFFGQGAISPGQVRLEYRSDPFAIDDPVIAQFAEEIAARMRAEGRLYQGPPVMKLAAADLNGNDPHLVVQPCDYGLQAGTCLALDFADDRFAEFGGTLRDYYRHDCDQPTIKNNPLAICLGVCGYLLVEQAGHRHLLQVERAAHLASLEGERGPSVAGVVDWQTEHENLEALFRCQMGVEIEEELNLRMGEYELTPLGWGIELFRGERPQVFCLVRGLLSRSEIETRLSEINSRDREHQSFEWVELGPDGSVDAFQRNKLNFEAKMNGLLVRDFLS